MLPIMKERKSVLELRTNPVVVGKVAYSLTLVQLIQHLAYNLTDQWEIQSTAKIDGQRLMSIWKYQLAYDH